MKTLASTEEARGAKAQDAYLVIPPLIRYSAGPLLGPAIVEGKTNSAGFKAKTLDLNIAYLHSTGLLPAPDVGEATYLGDHCKTQDVLDQITRLFWASMSTSSWSAGVNLKQTRMLSLSQGQVAKVVENLAHTPLGEFLVGQLERLRPPAVLGISVMWEWQVIPGLFLSLVSKKIWPKAIVVWGGPHVTAISDLIARDSGYGRWVDGFLPFQSENSFVKLLENPHQFGEVEGLIVPGSESRVSALRSSEVPSLPSFPDFGAYGRPRLILPVELSVGCPYGRCSFCTYPTIEGKYREFPTSSLDFTLELAKRNAAAISLKDSLVTHLRLLRVAERVRGEVQWSATTKLHDKLDNDLIGAIASGGCRTLEVGLETLDPETQKAVEKRQPVEWLEKFLTACGTHGVSVVVNYITGFPWEDEKRSREFYLSLQRLLRQGIEDHQLRARPEHHRFRLERLSPMATQPEAFGMKVTAEWPWSSVLAWKRLPTQPIQLSSR